MKGSDNLWGVDLHVEAEYTLRVADDLDPDPAADPLDFLEKGFKIDRAGSLRCAPGTVFLD